MEKHPWLISILYILVLYGWIGFVIYGMKYFNLNKWLSLGFNIVFLIAFITLLTVQISRALPEIRSGNIDYCINGFLFFKYTILPSTLYFIFLALVIFVGGISVSLVVFYSCNVFNGAFYTYGGFYTAAHIVGNLFYGRFTGICFGSRYCNYQ